MKVANDWKDYEILDMANGEKLERWGNIFLVRPDPQIIWVEKSFKEKWKNVHGIYNRSKTGGGSWNFKKKVPESWQIKYKNLTFNIKPMGFKHTGIFPEQATNWDYIMEKVSAFGPNMRVLNLFAYTGCATMASSIAGAEEVVHVDASKGMTEWAKENMKLCKLENNKIRFIVDDVIKFLEREKRRGRTYHGVIMDPPSYGRGPNGEVWRLVDNLKELLQKVKDILDENYSFVLINSYTTGVSPTSLNNILSMTFKGKNIETGEIGLPITENNLVLPCGIYGRID